MNTMTYKNYAARVEYSDEDACFIGHIAGIRTISGFHATSVAGLQKAFREAVDHYLKTCAELGQKPEKPYSGHIGLRVPPSLHAEMAAQADLSGTSLNKWAVGALENALHTDLPSSRQRISARH